MKKLIQIILVQLFAIVCLWVFAYSQIVGPPGNTSLVSPGPIGGTTSSTGQFTQLCSGVSPCTLSGTIGDIAAERSGTTGVYFFGNPSNNNDIQNDGSTYHFVQSGSDRVQVTTTSLSLPGGVTLQSTGGAAPTLTAGCNGAGSSFNASSTNNRGQFTTQTAAATTCTITWSAAGTWGQAPFCVFSGALVAIVPPASPGTSTYVITFTATSAAVVENYVCM